jgi:hypothetical protein
MENYDIPGMDMADHTFGIGRGDLGIVSRLAGSKRTQITGRPVQTIVKPFGNGKELGVASHDQPVHV